MNILQKQLLGWAGLGLMIFTSMLVIALTNHTWNSATTTNTVSFSGQGKVAATPDVAVVDLAIVTEAATSKAAQDENSQKSKAVVDFLKKQGIDDKDIKTSGYNIYPQYDYTSGRSVLRGYQVSQSIQVKVRDLEKIDTVLDGVVTAGANQINQLQLTIDDPVALQEEARNQAIKDAKAKADRLEDQLGISLGRIIGFSENEGGPMPPIFYKADSAVGGRGGGGPAVPTGENEIIVNVTITYQIR